GSVDEVLQQERLLSELAPHSKPDSLTALACARARLYLAEAVARESWNMPPGTSWHEGAVRAVGAALRAGARTTQTTELLGVLLLSEPRVDSQASAVDLLLGRIDAGEPLARLAVRGCT